MTTHGDVGSTQEYFHVYNASQHYGVVTKYLRQLQCGGV